MTNTPAPQAAPGYWTPNNAAPRLGTSPRGPVNYMAWTGLLVSVSGFLFNLGINGVIGVIFSIIGMREARRLSAAGHENTGQQMALAGLIIGIAHIIVTAALIVLAVFAFFWFTDWVNTLTTQFDNSNLRSAF